MTAFRVGARVVFLPDAVVYDSDAQNAEREVECGTTGRVTEDSWGPLVGVSLGVDENGEQVVVYTPASCIDALPPNRARFRV